MSGLLNKDNHGSGAPEGTFGTHNSRAANAADPRIDSDLDGRGAGGLHSNTGSSGLHSNTGSSGLHSSTGTTGSSGLHGSVGGPAPNTDGPHKSDLLNKADPRVDSDRDYSKNMGLNSDRSADPSKGPSAPGAYRGENVGHESSTLGSSTHGNTLGSSTHGNTLGSSTHGNTTGHSTLGSSTGTHGTTGHSTLGSSGTREGDFGPHSSRAANAADPRVDSDRDGSRHTGGGLGSSTGHSGTHGTTGTHHTTGTHNTTGTHGTSGLGATGPSSHSTGPAPNTAGPHKSDLLNKLDPRVDSNLDGSKTVGGDKTHAANH